MKTNSLTLPVLMLFAIIAILAGCNKELNEKPISKPVKTMSELKVPAGFNFTSTSLIEFTIEVKSPDNQPLKGVTIRVFNDFEDNGGTLLFSGITGLNGIFTTNHPLPNRFSEVIITTNYLGLPGFVIGNVSDGKVRALLGGPNQPSLKSGSLPFKSMNVLLQPMGGYNDLGVPDYLVVPDDIIDPTLLNMVNATLPEYQNVPVAHPGWVDPSINYDLKVIEESQVWITFIDEGACWTNTLGFYTYHLNNPPATKDDINTIFVVFPNASAANGSCGVGGLYAGNKVYLGQFPDSTGIGLVLLTKGWSTSSKQVGMGTNQFYSNPDFNPQAGGPNAQYRQQFVMLFDAERDIFLTGIEDQLRPAGDNDFNDLVFYITAVEVGGVDTTDYGNPILNATDTDGDGVPDDVDEYPNDPERAFNVYFPSQNTFGTLAFEDLWPSTGDYDFNDKVVDYNIQHVTNALNEVVDIIGTLRLRAMGASFRNGFGFQLGVEPGDIAGVELIYQDNTTVSQPLESGQNKAVFIAWQNGFNLLPHQGGVIGVNTTLGTSPIDYYELRFEISTAQPLRLIDLGVPPYNPFMYINQERGREVHLIDFAPTTQANFAFFGTFSDASDVDNLEFYKTSTGLPWAIHIGESFSYPIEKVSIINAYNHFVEWAESGGTEKTDWYSNQPGYRNPENIY